ncbi:MAG TPA: baseplate J/gp47 family protein [Oscillospiraceae bacterium]|nr:baseplate J/gp47 family protein [Oscillospiraceae bacterium]HRW57203.1 baseplate J/gp47 family protein [Oscillospiraceae bacterium]
MLQVPKLDDLDYKKLFERARGMIPALTDEWTDYNLSDPGITTLQTFAWLYDSLNYYLGATGEIHRLKYYKLLGIYPEQSASRCRIAIDAEPGTEILMPRGTKLAAGDVIFETQETYRGTAGRRIGIYNEVSGKKTDLSAFAGTDGEFAPVFALGTTDTALYLGFTCRFSGAVRIFVEAESGWRNPFGDGFSLSETAWEFYDGRGWKAAELVSDETCGFLRSGYIFLNLPGPTGIYGRKDMNRGHYLRCTLKRNEYDVLPTVGRVLVNCAEAVQTDTFAEALEVESRGEEEVAIDYNIGEKDVLGVWVRKDRAYEEYCKPGEVGRRCTVEPGDFPWQKKIRFAKRYIPEKGTKILITIHNSEVAYEMDLGKTDGCANQSLSFDAKNVCDIRLALSWEENGRTYCRLWNRCTDLYEAGYDDEVFSYDGKNRTVTFGDSIHGMQPEPNLTVTAVTVRTSRLQDGNVLADRVDAYAGPDLGYGITNPCPAEGGVSRVTGRDLDELIEQKLNAVTRAVNEKDYRQIILSTPGLMIDSVAVIPMKEYCRYTNEPFRPNTVYVAVKPKSGEPCPVLSETYRRIISEHLEKFRLLTTDIVVIPARYNAIDVYCRLVLSDKTAAAKAEVESTIRKMVDTVSTGEYGRRVDYGRLFSALEMLGCVKSVSQLSIEYIGAGARKTDNGDIEVYPDSLTYPHEIGIEYV